MIKIQLLTGICIFISFCVYGADQKIKEVTIQINDAKFKRLLYNCPFSQITILSSSRCNETEWIITDNHLLLSAPRPKSKIDCYLATYKEFQDIAEIQSHNTDACIQIPIILFSSGKVSPTENCAIGFYAEGNPKIFCKLILPLQLFQGDSKKGFIGHELRHIFNWYNDIENEHTEIARSAINTFETRKQYFLTASALFTEYKLITAYINSQPILTPSLYFGNTLILCTLGFYRYVTYQNEKVYHAVELGCDKSAVDIRKTPEEKIAIAEETKKRMHLYHPKNYEHSYWWHILSSIFTASTYPSVYICNQQMNNIIAEQEAIIKQRDNQQ